MNRSIPTQQPWVALGSPATQEFYALVRNYGVKRMVRLKVESLYTVPYSSEGASQKVGQSSTVARVAPAIP